MSVDQIAELLHADRSTVYRWLERVEAERPTRPTLEAFERMLEGVELDKPRAMKAQIGRALAEALDVARTSKVAQDRVGMEGKAKQLGEIIDELLDISDSDKDWIRGLFD